MGLLALDDIQGNILRGYGFPAATYLFFEISDAAAGRSFVGQLVDRVQDATAWVPPGPATTTNVAITFPGLVALGVPEGMLAALPASFREPMRARASRLLGDRGPNAPSSWDDGIGTERCHLLVTINARDGEGDAFVRDVTTVLTAAQSHEVRLVHRQESRALPHRREHFGWADGFGQPAIEGAPWSEDPGNGVPLADRGWRSLKAGEFVHGYEDEDGQIVSGPAADLLRNGTFMVYRKLYQDIVAFREQLRDDATAYGASRTSLHLDPDQLYELMAAKVVGRWRDGEPIVNTPLRVSGASRSLGDAAAPDPSNDFRYLPDDANGFSCPLGAHIRRTNPRDALGWDGRMSLRHRIIRRGMPYGPFLEFEEGQRDDGEDRGLLFICFNTSFERQFEVIQRQWCLDGNAFRLGNDKDYLLGDPDAGDPAAVPSPDGRSSSGRIVIEGSPPHFVTIRAPVVRTRGCAYLLMPGLEALRKVASGRWVDAEDRSVRGEREAIERVAALSVAQMEADDSPDVRPVLRDQHAKSHGCVRAEFEVSANLPDALRRGLFAEPRTYAAWIRFSSGSGGPALRSDAVRDAHGMAIKVMGVDGPHVLGSELVERTQDFVLANSPVFFCREPIEYVELVSRVNEDRILRFFFGWNPRRWKVHQFINLVRATKRKVRNPLEIRYWSQTPSSLGPIAVKYSAAPHGTRPRATRSKGADVLETEMARTLQSGSARFDFMVQVQQDPTRMPIDDPTIRWNERASPFHTVATITIPSQIFSTDERREFAENLSFTPWHSLVEHRPLGGINRARRVVYEATSAYRHAANGVPRIEPNGET